MIRLADVTKTYHVGAVEINALRGVDLFVADGDFLAVMGPSGCGKSTLLHVAGCLDTPTSGHVELRGTRVSDLSERELARLRATEIGFVFQTFNLLWDETALENVELPLLYAGVRSRRRAATAAAALERVGLGPRARHRPWQLSGGEQQRVAIARALVKEPAVLLADEPTGNLDSASGEHILDLFSTLHDEGSTIIMVTHEQGVAERAGRILHMRDGVILPDGEVATG